MVAHWITHLSSGCGGQLKYENVYPKDYASGHAPHRGLRQYFDYYNNERKHSNLDNDTPADVFFGLEQTEDDSER